MSSSRLPIILVGLFAMSCYGQTNVPTSHNDNWRTGQNTSETHLKTSSFAKQRFWAALQNFPAVKPAAGTNLRSMSVGHEAGANCRPSLVLVSLLKSFRAFPARPATFVPSVVL
jgi:hypothetical protein